MMPRLRLPTSVLVAPCYPALVLANRAATLDVVSGGRLIPGVGTGWIPAEFDAVGVPARERGARADDHLAAARTLTPSAASVADDLRRLAEAGLAACTLWPPIAAEHLEQAVEWIASEAAPRLADS